MVSGRTDKDEKEWKDKNLSGCYHMVEIVNDRPAYKVSFCSSQKTLATKGLLLFNSSEAKRLKVVLKYLFGIKRE